jgi:hypothetical protein
MAQGAGGQSRSQLAHAPNVHRRGGVGGFEHSVLAIPLSRVKIARLAVVTGSLSTEGCEVRILDGLLDRRGYRAPGVWRTWPRRLRFSIAGFRRPLLIHRVSPGWRSSLGVCVGDLLGKATPSVYAGGAVTLSSPQQQLQARALLADHPMALRRIKLALGFAHTRYSRWCAGITLSPIGVLVEPFRFDLSID